MAIYQKRSQRKATGGRYKKLKVKRLSQLGGLPTLTRIDETKRKFLRVRGGNQKVKILKTNKINVIDPKQNKAQVATIISTQESPDNRNYVRRNIITKGAILKTDIGLVKVTSRPGQVGTLNGVLIE